jgi:hypothetical protein
VLNAKLDELVDRFKGRRRVSTEGAAEEIGDVFFDVDGTKWLCVEAERDERRLTLDFDGVEPFNLSRYAKRAVLWTVATIFTVASIAAPIYWFFWRNA